MNFSGFGARPGAENVRLFSLGGFGQCGVSAL